MRSRHHNSTPTLMWDMYRETEEAEKHDAALQRIRAALRALEASE